MTSPRSRLPETSADGRLPSVLPALWRSRAADLEPYSPPAAEAFRRAAEELEESLALAADQPITPDQVEREGVCTAETVRRKVRAGELENIGTPGKIQVRRGDLDKLPRGRTQRSGRGAAESSSFGTAPRRAALTAMRRRERGE